MAQQRAPFNIKLLKITPGQLRLLQPIGSLDRYEGANNEQFHSEGLFSTEIFGRVGDEARDQTFSYIPLKTQILHPVVYQRLGKLKRLYTQILERKAYAVWDEESKDFLPSNEADGETGFAFFMRHWNELSPERRGSDDRDQRIDLIEKYRDEAVIDNVLVMPAGLRDAEADSLGRTREDEINDDYRQLFGISNTVPNTSAKNDKVLDRARLGQQNAFNQIYKKIEDMLTGKKGYIQSKWGRRRVMDGTRNVISSMDLAASDVDSVDTPGSDDTVIGLRQLSRAAMPVTIQRLREGVLAHAFGDVEGTATLIDKKSLKPQQVDVDPQTHDRWTTAEGLEQVINLQEMKEYRSKPVEIDGYYLALVYKPADEKVFKIIYGIDELPDNVNKEDVYPITYMELIYLSNYRQWNDLRVMVTRYPVTGEESTYPSRVFVRTTVESESRVELDDDWEPMDAEDNTAKVYPIFDPPEYVDTVMVHSMRLAGLGGDFDGDTVSANVLYTKESIEEIDKYLKTRQAHVDPSGGLRASAHIDTAALVMHNITGEPEQPTQ